MFGIGAPELLIVLVILLLLFGGTKLPQLSRSIGESLRELRKGIDGPIETDKPTNTKSDSPESQS